MLKCGLLGALLLSKNVRGPDMGFATGRGQGFLAMPFPVSHPLFVAALAMAGRATDAGFVKR